MSKHKDRLRVDDLHRRGEADASDYAAAVIPIHEPRNGLGIAALALGIAALVFSLMPITGFLAVILGATGLILGLAARGRLKRGTATNGKTTWAGIVTSVLGLVIGVVGIFIVFDTLNQFDEDMQELEQEFDIDG